MLGVLPEIIDERQSALGSMVHGVDAPPGSGSRARAQGALARVRAAPHVVTLRLASAAMWADDRAKAI